MRCVIYIFLLTIFLTVSIQIPNADAYTLNEYHTYSSMVSELKNISDTFSDITYLFSIGKTYEGRDIYVMKISDNVYEDNVTEPDVLYMGAHHGNEKTSYEVLIYFINYIVENYYRDTEEGAYVRKIVNSRELYIIPMVNPDGVEANTRKNREPNYGPMGRPLPDCYGVDLNRNYDYMWFCPNLASDHYNPYSDTYTGEKPFSEKETMAIRDFVNQHGFRISVSYHTYGEVILYPWGWTPEPPPDEDTFIRIGNEISAINNYTVMQASDFYRTSGDSEDYLYGRKNIIAFTIELGQEYAPDLSIVENISSVHVDVNMYIAEVAGKLGKEIIVEKETFAYVYLGSVPAMIINMVVFFGIVYGGLWKCIDIAIKSDKMRRRNERTVEK